MTEKQGNTKKDDGGPAFPTDQATDFGMLYPKQVSGMSLRDYFAGQFAIGFWSANRWMRGADEAAAKQGLRLAQMIAAKAYEHADAMLAERAK